jgi:hypothetical protein
LALVTPVRNTSVSRCTTYQAVTAADTAFDVVSLAERLLRRRAFTLASLQRPTGSSDWFATSSAGKSAAAPAPVTANAIPDGPLADLERVVDLARCFFPGPGFTVVATACLLDEALD